MIEKGFLHLMNGIAYIRKHPQLLLTSLLIVFIPLAFIFSGQQFLHVAKMHQENLEQERLGLLQDLFVGTILSAQGNVSHIQNEIDRISGLNSDIVNFFVAEEIKGLLTIIASNQQDQLGTQIEKTQQFKLSFTSSDISFMYPRIEYGERFWEVYRSVQTPDDKQYYIFTKTSLEHIDALLERNIRIAYYWLIGILLIVLLLLIRHVKLIDYAYLYRETKRHNEMKDLFTNMIAHELRAPLTAMRGYASLINEDAAASSQTKERARNIEDSAKRLLLIITDLLDVARIQSGKLAMQPARINLPEVSRTVLESLKSIAEEKHIILALDDPRTPIYATLDEKRFFQALTNIVSNAVKYTKAGTITVTFEERHDRIEVRVKDTGMGMSAEHQKHLFAPFFRIENVETKDTIGSGLGMWITKQLIELMHGSIGVESIKGVGTHIVITLPK